MKTSIKLDAKILTAFPILAAKNDKRYHLNGVNVKATFESVCLYATNGSILGAYRLQALDANRPAFDIIIPNETLASLKLSKADDIVTLTVDCDESHGQSKPCSIKTQSAEVHFKSIDGKFPDFERVTNDAAEPSGEHTDFDPELIVRFSQFARKACGIGKHKIVRVRYALNGDGPAPVRIADIEDFYGLAMPWRLPTDEPVTLPAWAMPEQTQKQKQAA